MGLEAADIIFRPRSDYTPRRFGRGRLFCRDFLSCCFLSCCFLGHLDTPIERSIRSHKTVSIKLTNATYPSRRRHGHPSHCLPMSGSSGRDCDGPERGQLSSFPARMPGFPPRRYFDGIRASRDAGRLLSMHRQCVPGRERVHVVSPVRDFPVFNPDD